MDSEHLSKAGHHVDGKDNEAHELNIAARRAKLTRKAEEAENIDVGSKPDDRPRRDDFYSEVLMRFGIQI